MISDPMFYAVAIPAVILLGLAKGGFTGLAVTGVPLLALVMSPIRAASIILPILIVQDAVGVWVYRHDWDKRILKITVPGACLGILLAYLFASRVSDAGISFAVGIISVIFSLKQLLAERFLSQAEPKPPHRAAGFLCGAMSGFTSMISNSGGPLFQIYVLPQRLPRQTLVGTQTIFFAMVNWIKVPPSIALGQFTRENLTIAGVLLPLAVASTLAGVVLVRRVPTEGFYRIIYGLLLVVGAKLLWSGAHALF